jgi:DNA-directed DNA polymerase III PolC
MFLNGHSWFSFHYGTLPVEELLQEAKEYGCKRLALTDINNTSGVLDFIRLAPKYDIQPIAGIEFREGHQLRFIAIAANNDGFEEINRFLSICLSKAAQEGESATKAAARVPERAPSFRNAFVIYPFSLEKTFRLRENEFIGIRPSEINRYLSSNLRHSKNCIALLPVTLTRSAASFNLHRLLRAMGDNTLLSKVEPTSLCEPADYFETESVLHERYNACPELLVAADELASQCSIAFDFKESKNRRTFSGSKVTDKHILEKETWKGADYRYGKNIPENVRERIEKELRMISDLGYSAYFLINWDILRYARRKGYCYVGRGSGANSIVAYCLRITDVDPIDLDLYFERFINPFRSSPPDFDLDFSWKERDDILGYIFKRYGEEHTALLATYSTYQSNAVVRELGKVFGLPPAEIDALQSWPEGKPLPDKIAQTIRKYSALLQDFPNHLSIHAGGVLISEQPIACYTAISHPPKGFPLTQFSMLEAEDIGLYKFDILSQRGLGHIRDTVDIVKKNRGEDIDIHDVNRFKEDEKIKALIRNGKCMGCFYVESPAMRMLLKKLSVDAYLQLVAASSIIRPGVARSGMMREYILRTHDASKRTYIHPVMKELMEETYGIMVYQEDVIKVAHHFAGLDLSEADVLRRGMSGKFRSREQFTLIRDRFFNNCKEKGYPEHITAEVWRQIESFAGYSFSKGHSASYAVESYQSLFLKAYYPLEFMVGVINNFGGFYQTEFYVHEARMSGAAIHAPDINKSEYLTCINGTDIYLGFVHLHGLEQKTAFAIEEERKQNGDYVSLQDFMKRIPVTLEQLRILVRIGAFRVTGRSKKQLLWDIHLHLGEKKRTVVAATLFDEPGTEWKLPELYEGELDHAMDEIELLGFALRSPFELMEKTNYKAKFPVVVARTLQDFKGKEVELTGYLVTIKPTRTIKGESMAFGCFLDEEGHFVDTTHFPKISKEFPFRGRGLYRVRGRVDEEFNFCSLTVISMEKLPMKLQR